MLLCYRVEVSMYWRYSIFANTKL